MHHCRENPTDRGRRRLNESHEPEAAGCNSTRRNQRPSLRRAIPAGLPAGDSGDASACPVAIQTRESGRAIVVLRAPQRVHHQRQPAPRLRSPPAVPKTASGERPGQSERRRRPFGPAASSVSGQGPCWTRATTRWPRQARRAGALLLASVPLVGTPGFAKLRGLFIAQSRQ